MIEKTVNITNFIGVYDNYILPEECNKAIELVLKKHLYYKNKINSFSWDQVILMFGGKT